MKSQTAQWGRFGGITAILAVVFYFLAAFAPLPDWLGRLLVFAFGPILSLSFLGWYRFLAIRRSGPVLQSACLCGIIAGVVVTSMLTLQVGNNMVATESLAAADTAEAELAAEVAWSAVNRVQYLLDVVWDIFICAATILLGVSLFSHESFGKILGGVGVFLGLLLLIFNLVAFPYPPAEVGSIDFGPLVALWILIAAVRLLLVSGRYSGPTGESSQHDMHRSS